MKIRLIFLLRFQFIGCKNPFKYSTFVTLNTLKRNKIKTTVLIYCLSVHLHLSVKLSAFNSNNFDYKQYFLYNFRFVFNFIILWWMPIRMPSSCWSRCNSIYSSRVPMPNFPKYYLFWSTDYLFEIKAIMAIMKTAQFSLIISWYTHDIVKLYIRLKIYIAKQKLFKGCQNTGILLHC